MRKKVVCFLFLVVFLFFCFFFFQAEDGIRDFDCDWSSDVCSSDLWTVNGHAGAAAGVHPTLSWADLQALGIAATGSYTVSVTVSDGRGGVTTSPGTPLIVTKATPTRSEERRVGKECRSMRTSMRAK